MLPTSWGLATPSSSNGNKVSENRAAVLSRPFAVPRQVRMIPCSSARPQTDAAAQSSVVFPIDDDPRRLKPPLSPPTNSRRGGSKAVATANIGRLCPATNFPIDACQSCRLPAAPYGDAAAPATMDVWSPSATGRGSTKSSLPLTSCQPVRGKIVTRAPYVSVIQIPNEVSASGTCGYLKAQTCELGTKQ